MKGLIFTYGLTFGGSAAALFNPYYGFLVYVCFAIVRPSAMWPWSVPEGNYSRIIAIALIAGWYLQGMGNWNFGRGRHAIHALGVFWLLTLFSTLAAPNRDLAWWFFESLTKILLPLFIGCTLINSIERLKQLTWVVVLSQGFVAYEMNLSYFQGVNRLLRDGFASLDNNTASVAMVVCAGLAFFLAIHERSRWRQAVAVGIFLLSTHAVMFSFSRGALLSLIFTGIVTVVMLPKRPAYITAMIVAAVVGFRLAGPEVVDRFLTVFADKSERDASAESRLDLWRGCMQEMVDNPLLGIGPQHWQTVAHHHGFEYGKAAHSMWMQAGAEIGVFGLGALLLVFVLPIAQLWKIANGRDPNVDPELVPYAQMVVASLCGFIVAAQFVSVALVEIPYYIMAVGVGALKLASLPVYLPADDPELASASDLPVQAYA